jgi:hypothetical protein
MHACYLPNIFKVIKLIKEDEMNRPCSVHGRDKKCRENFSAKSDDKT